MAHTHHDDPVHRDTTVIDDRGIGAGFGAGMMIAALAIVAAVIIGLALLFTQPWDDDGTVDSTPGVEDVVPDVPDGDDVPVPDGGGDAPAPDGGEAPAQ